MQTNHVLSLSNARSLEGTTYTFAQMKNPALMEAQVSTVKMLKTFTHPCSLEIRTV